MKLKAKKGKSKYKNTDTWLDAVYRNNKEFIDEKLKNVSVPKLSKRTIFKDIVKEYSDQGLSPLKALKTASNSEIFTSKMERLHNNAFSALKADKDAYKTFRELTKEHGRFTKMDETKLKWENGVYIYENIMISFQNSPYGIRVGRI